MTDLVETTENAPVENAEASNTEESVTSWRDSITDEELKGSKSLSNFKDVDGLAKSYINLEKKLGSPKEPESFDSSEYTYELPEGYQPQEDILNAVKEKAVELGVKPSAFKELIESFTGKESEILQQIESDKQEQANQFQETLKKEWGNAYEDKLKAADKTWQAFASEEHDKVLESMGLQEQLAISKVMANIASRISEPNVGNLSQNNNNSLTKEQAIIKISEIRNDPNSAYNRGELGAAEEMTQLYLAANS